jgi:hypothetical protein
MLSSDGKHRTEDEEAERAAQEVLAGSDSIEVPADLLEERPEPKRAGDQASLWARIQAMSVAEKVKLALHGNKEARTILLRGSNRFVQRMVLLNPRITEEEVLAVAKNRSADEELLRCIAERREWTANYAIRVALVENAKTPLAKAMRFLPTLALRELRALAKSKNVPTAIASQARRLLFQREGAGRSR